MQYTATFRLKLVATVVAGIFAAPAMAEDQVNKEQQTGKIKLNKVEVISTTPLPSLGLPLEQIPANVQTVKGVELQKQNSLSIADYMNQNLVGVTVNDTQNNPYQPDVSFRGFSASPLLGTPQGLSVFVDGVRINEPFGDVVNWDLIPVNALAGMSLIPGSNPLFGLNTLGGALSIQTKSGRTHQGGAVEAYTGSWGRKAGSAEYGGVSKDGSVDYFFSANSFTEDGWRKSSPTDVRQLFGKVGWQNETTAINLSYTGADNDMVGNGLAPADFLRSLGRSSIYTKPDRTENKMSFLNLSGSHWFNDQTMFSGNVYYRNTRTRTLNGDLNDDFNDGDVLDLDASGDLDASELAAARANCLAGTDADENCSGALNRSKSKRTGYGFTGQFSFNQDWMGKKNQFIVGSGYDYGRTKFSQSTEFGLINDARGIDGTGENEVDVKLKGVSKTWSLFATDTLSLTDKWHLTMSGRYNYTKVENTDGITALPDPTSLSGNHNFHRFNPAVGLNFTPTSALTIYGSYNEGSRAPTAIELGCANPDVPCKLPNAMAGDPPLDQVVAKTFEAGFRGQLSQSVRWSASAYRTNNYDDILFAAAGTQGFGFFKNFGQTRRQGIETSLFGQLDRFTWNIGYSYVNATYRSSETLVAENNSSADADDNIQIKSGDRIPGIPQHQLKLRGVFAIAPAWTFGTNVIAFSDQYARGNENNAHDGPGGKIGGYAVVNMDTRYSIGKGWQVFAKVNNVFDREYNNGGMLGETLFNSAGTFTGNETGQMPFYAPGAPRAGWIGVRWEFGGAKSNGDLN